MISLRKLQNGSLHGIQSALKASHVLKRILTFFKRQTTKVRRPPYIVSPQHHHCCLTVIQDDVYRENNRYRTRKVTQEGLNKLLFIALLPLSFLLSATDYFYFWGNNFCCYHTFLLCPFFLPFVKPWPNVTFFPLVSGFINVHSFLLNTSPMTRASLMLILFYFLG